MEMVREGITSFFVTLGCLLMLDDLAQSLAVSNLLRLTQLKIETTTFTLILRGKSTILTSKILILVIILFYSYLNLFSCITSFRFNVKI